MKKYGQIDSISYERGSLIRFYLIIWVRNFSEGLQHYIKYIFGSTTKDDLWESLNRNKY